jgi:predicted TIM-barrel fold metal-dependent hydrolase
MIDMHTHLHPPRLFAAIRRWFAEKSTWILTQPTEPHLVAQALRLAGVERFVFCSYAHKPGMARTINEWLIQTADELGGFGLPLATVHPADVDYVEYYREALQNGCVGIKIHEDVQGLSIDHPHFAPIHELTAKHQGFVLVHAGHIPWSDDTNDGPSRIRSVLEQHPQLSVVVAHLGSPDTERYLELMNEHPNLYIDTTMALAVSSPMRLEFDIELLIPHSARILFGSDFPNLPYDYPQEYAPFNVLPEAVRNAILFENANRLLAPHLSRL